MDNMLCKRLFNIYGENRGTGFAGNVWDIQGLSPTITTMGGGNREPMIVVMQKALMRYPHGYFKGGEWSNDYSPSLTTSAFEFNNTIMETEGKKEKQINLPPELQGKEFRIRKLTPRECFRLMGVDDADIDKIQASGVSNSAQYKLAGNSIVVDVLFHLFRKMFIETGPDIEKGEAVQGTLF